jgi:predicted DNA-binding transcriptional regulator YafY
LIYPTLNSQVPIDMLPTSPIQTRRQIEIIALVLSAPAKYSVEDLCHHFNVEVAAIRRDMSAIRSIGIDIRSRKNRITILNPVETDLLNLLVASYLSVSGGAVSYPKSISLLSRKLKDSILSIFVTLLNAIEKQRYLELRYRKLSGGEIVIRVVEPYDIVPTFRDWRLIAHSDGIFKQFLIENIQDAIILDERFERLASYSPDAIFRNSFNYWLGNEEIDVTLEFSKVVADQIRNGLWTENQRVENLKGGKVRLILRVNSIETIANWVLGWGKTVRVVEPQELRDYVVKLAKGFLDSNRKT